MVRHAHVRSKEGFKYLQSKTAILAHDRRHAHEYLDEVYKLLQDYATGKLS